MTIVIPAYKPDDKLIGLIKDLHSATDASLLVVNDGSGAAFDDIFHTVKEMGCTLLVHPENRGKGAALKTAFRYLAENAAADEIICTADADGQHLPKDIVRCMEEAEKHPEALVIGGRAFRGEVPFRSRFGNAVSRWTFYLLMGAKIHDTQTGLRAFSASMIPKMLEVEADRYEYEMQILCNAAKEKTPLREIEIETVYLEENKSSHFNPLRDAMRVYGLLIRNASSPLFQLFSFFFSSLFAFFIDVAGYALLFRLVFPFLLKDVELNAFVSLLIARIVSSLVNYAINRKVVFQNGDNPFKTLVLYSILAVLTFFANHEINTFFLINLGFHEVISLILAQAICFPASFLIQKFFIFPKKKMNKKEK